MNMTTAGNTKIRVRFAPSPTGHLHVGGARTALFNWLFAKHTGGVFILRIEDTDEARSTEESLNAILGGLTWLGLDWDEGPIARVGSKGGYGPYFQMQRTGLYKKYADELISKGLAYPCYCTPEELDAMRKKALLEKRPPKYEGKCRDLTGDERAGLEKQGRHPVLRFKCPKTGTTVLQDIIRGTINFDNALLDDFVLLKASGIPTYNFAVVIDDHHMDITHVIRGDDHLSNTPRQILLYQAFNWNSPQFAHLSMILGPDGSRLSKRHGATSVEEYKETGYLPEAMVNYLALLGWATEDSQQLFRPEELFEKFSLERCGKSPAIFSQEKLLWMNGEYIRKMPVSELARRAMPYVEAGGISIVSSHENRRNNLEKAIGLEQEKIKLLSDVPQLVDFFFKDEIEYDPGAISKIVKTPFVSSMIEDIRQRFTNLEPFDSVQTEKLCREYAGEKGIKTNPLFHSIRVAVSGRMQGPSLFHMLELLGKDTVIQRLRKAEQLITAKGEGGL